jgi:hypothetical protein
VTSQLVKSRNFGLLSTEQQLTGYTVIVLVVPSYFLPKLTPFEFLDEIDQLTLWSGASYCSQRFSNRLSIGKGHSSLFPVFTIYLLYWVIPVFTFFPSLLKADKEPPTGSSHNSKLTSLLQASKLH